GSDLYRNGLRARLRRLPARASRQREHDAEKREHTHTADVRSKPRAGGGGGSAADGDLAEQLQLVEYLARAERHAGERIGRNGHGQVRLVAYELIEASQERAAAGHHDALIDDVRGQLGRRVLEADPYGLHDRRHALPQRLADLVVADEDRL